MLTDQNAQKICVKSPVGNIRFQNYLCVYIWKQKCRSQKMDSIQRSLFCHLFLGMALLQSITHMIIVIGRLFQRFHRSFCSIRFTSHNQLLFKKKKKKLPPAITQKQSDTPHGLWILHIAFSNYKMNVHPKKKKKNLITDALLINLLSNWNGWMADLYLCIKCLFDNGLIIYTYFIFKSNTNINIQDNNNIKKKTISYEIVKCGHQNEFAHST